MLRIFILIAGFIAASSAAAGTLREALDKAWERNPQAQGARAREAELQARRQAAEGLLPAPPAVSLSHRSDQLNKNAGKHEWEAELGLPLWLPGQKQARIDHAASEQTEWSATLAALRLEIAGELRERVWAAVLAGNELELHMQRLETAAILERDVARRVAAGDLARTDLLLAQNDTLAARFAVLDNQSKLGQAMQSYYALTGDERLPGQREEQTHDEASLDTHPRLEAARTAIALAQAKLRDAMESRRDPPELSVGTRRERASFDEPYSDTVSIKLRLPFATEARNRPLITAAETELARAQAEYRQARIRVEADIRQKRHEYHAALAQLDITRGKQALTAENLALLQKAFDLGELDLVNLMRAKALAHEANLALIQQTIAVARTRAALNQALGVLP